MLDRTILVTGFCPFGEHSINPSWQTVKRLEDTSFMGYKLIQQEIPVEYKFADEGVPKLWQQHKPTLVVHVGVSKEATKITLESLARRKPYERPDGSGQSHPTGEVCSEEKGPDVIETGINIDQVIKEVECENYQFCKSKDAGHFVCEYTYYTSLMMDKNRALFVHVPLIDHPYTVEQLTEALTTVIQAILRLLEQKDNAVK